MDIQDLLKRHAPTLKDVAFVFLTTSDRVAVMKRLRVRETKWPHLKSFVLDGCMSEDQCTVYFRDCLTHMTDADPVEEAQKEPRKLREAKAAQ